MAGWAAECSSDSECENLFVAIGGQFKLKNLEQVLSSIRDGEDALECMKNVRRKKLSKKVEVASEPVKQERDTEASDTTPSDHDMYSPVSTKRRELKHAYQQQRFAANRTSMHARAHTHTHTRTHTPTHTPTHAHNMYIHIYICMYVRTRTHRSLCNYAYIGCFT